MITFFRPCDRGPARLSVLAAAFMLLATPKPGSAGPEPRRFDVILLVDASPEMAALSRKSAMVVVEAMSDEHRLGITTFGETARVIRPLGRVATVKEKMAALRTLNDAAFEDSSVDLRVGLESAITSLEKGKGKRTERVIILLAGAPSEPESAAEKERFKAAIPPRLLKEEIRLFVVAKQSADVALLQQTANLTDGKLLAAFDVETMTDALDTVVEKLAPPETVIVTKEVPIKTRVVSEVKESADEKLARNRAESRRLLVLGLLGTVLALLLVGVIVLQLLAMRRLSGKGAAERKPDGDKQDKSSFAKLRDLANALNNTVVDANEMVAQLNLDLEDFGVEKWRTEKGLVKQFGDLAAGLFLILDHIELRSGEMDEGAADWFRRKLSRLMEDAGIGEMVVEIGDRFDGLHHKHVGEEASEMEKGSVLSVKRPGYVADDPAKPGEKMVLRQAEVVVSLGGKGKEKT